MSCDRIVRFWFLLVVLLCLGASVAYAQQITGTDRHASLLCADGAVFSWGYNLDALLGDGTTVLRTEAVSSGVSSISFLHCNSIGATVVDSNGGVFVWGGVKNNQYGMPSWLYIEPSPKRIDHISGVRKAVSNSSNAYYLLNNGRLAVSGQNSVGQHGNGTTDALDSGHVFVNVDHVVDILCASSAVFAVQEDGTVLGWGYNGENQVDTSSERFVNTPKVVLKTNGIVSTSGSYGHGNNGSMRVVTVEGDLYVWGNNVNNVLGFAEPDIIKTPMKLSLSRKCVAVAGGLWHTLALLEDGTVWSWGDNAFGQLGTPFDTNSVEPVQAIGLNNVVAIGAGAISSYAITGDGKVWGWGDNTYRQLNRDDAPRQYTPVPLPLPCSLVSRVDESGSNPLHTFSPNPVRELLTMHYNIGVDEVRIMNIQGETIVEMCLPNSSTTATVDLSTEPAGVYYVIFSQGLVAHSYMVVKL